MKYKIFIILGVKIDKIFVWKLLRVRMFQRGERVRPELRNTGISRLSWNISRSAGVYNA